jgi:hypothetical protein
MASPRGAVESPHHTIPGAVGQGRSAALKNALRTGRPARLRCFMLGGRLLTYSLLAGALAGCVSRHPALLPADEWTYDNPALGVSFAVPAAWSDEVEGAAVVVGGPPKTPAYFTTLTLQASPVGTSELTDLERVLHASWEHGPGDEPPQVLARAPTLAAGLPALRYLVSFDLHERARLRAGLLLRHGASVIDLAYVAPREQFAAGLPVFERALDTLALAPADDGEP